MNISGGFSGVRTAKQVVVRDSRSFAELWKQHQPNGSNPVPGIDFVKQDVVAVFAGGKPTGGHSIAIDSVENKGKSAIVHVKIHKPAPGTIVAQMFTYPFAIRAVPKLPRTVKFEITEVAGP